LARMERHRSPRGAGTRAGARGTRRLSLRRHRAVGDGDALLSSARALAGAADAV
jgi:hypothetical protein